MTKLEKEILHQIIVCEFATQVDGEFCFQPETVAKAAAEVAKKYIEKAFYANPGQRAQELCGMKSQEELYQEWLKENGIV